MAALLAGLAAGALWMTPAWGQDASPEAAAAAKWAPAITGDNPKERLEAMRQMRADREMARKALVYALAQRGGRGHSWLGVALREFGTMGDVSPLLGEYFKAEDEESRARFLGAVRKLYVPPAKINGNYLVAAVSVRKTGAAEAYQPNVANTFLLSDASFVVLHQEDIPYGTLRKILFLRGVTHDSRNDLNARLVKSLSPGEWAAYRDILQLQIENPPARKSQSVMVTATLKNPLDRPLLLLVAYEAWWGRFDGDPRNRVVYLGAKESRPVERELRLVANRPGHPVRVDVRAMEFSSGETLSAGHGFMP